MKYETENVTRGRSEGVEAAEGVAVAAVVVAMKVVDGGEIIVMAA